jgi:Tol biopolymer transport system component
MDADGGNVTRITQLDGDNYDAEWSPTGKRIVFTSAKDERSEIFTINAGGTDITNITNGRSADLEPTWSPDGTRIAFVSISDNGWHIYAMAPDGSAREPLTLSEN